MERGTISVPTVSGSLTYNGQAQSPTLTGYDADKMVLSGDTSGTNAGSYTAVVTPESRLEDVEQNKADKQEVAAVWDSMAVAYQEGVQEA